MWIDAYRFFCVPEWLSEGLPLDFSYSTLVGLFKSSKCPNLKGTPKLQISL